MFFNKDNKNIENDNLIKVSALLIHAAKIDENYSLDEEKIIKETLLEIGANNENIDKIIEDGKRIDQTIKEGEIFLLPKLIPHSPQRYENTVGLVIEYKRADGELDAFQWYCDSCHNLLHEVKLDLVNIVSQLPPLFEAYWNDTKARTCSRCNEIQNPPS